MEWKVVLLEKEASFGEALIKYVEKKERVGKYRNWTFCHIKDEQELSEENLGNEKSTAESTEENSLFFLIGRGFSEKAILSVLHENEEMKERRWAYGELKEEPSPAFYRFGGAEKLLRDIEERISGKCVSTEKNTAPMIIASVGMHGAAGDESLLDALSEGLGRKGFRILSVDLNIWEGNEDGVESSSLQLSYLRFLYRKAPEEFLDSLKKACGATGEMQTLRIAGITEMDCEGGTLRADVKDMLTRIRSENLFDFIFLKANRLHLAEGYLHEMGIHGLLIEERAETRAGDTIGERLCEFYGRDEKLTVARVLWGEKMDSEVSISRIPCFQFQLEQLVVEERKVGAPLLGKRVRRGAAEKEDRFVGTVGPLADFLVERWMKTEKLRRNC